MEFIWQALRQVAFLLDQAVYSLIPSAYELIFYLANINIATNDIFVAIINRIYLLLGIFMLFKVSFSIMQYIVDPNAFSDKSKGFGKLVTNSLVSIVLLAMVPWIFATAYDLQNKIILSNAIPRIVLGDTSYGDYSEGGNDTGFQQKQNEIHSLGVDVQFTMFSAFYTLNTTSNGGYESCDPGETGKTLSNIIGSSDMVTTCWDEIEPALTEEIHKQGGTLKGLFKYCDDDSCSTGITDERDFATFKYLLWWMKDGGQSNFTINYTPIISAVVGGYLLLLLITFAIDIATRVFRLMFLQMVAPIAIISYVDPKESASNGRLHNWAIECGKTYVSLFLRLAVIYLAVQLIRLLTSVVFTAMTNSGSLYYNGIAPEGALNIFVYILLILGIFTFAKKLPQMIERIFNIKLSGEMHLNPFKAISENPIGAGLAGGTIGGIAGGIAGFRAGGEAGAALRGAALGSVRGISGGANEGLKPGMFGKVRGKVYKEMTGNDLRTFNPLQSVLRPGSGRKIAEVGEPLSQAKAQKAAYEERLMKAQAANKNADALFAKHGVNTSGFIKTDGSTDDGAISAERANWVRNRTQASSDLTDARNRQLQLAQRRAQYESQISRLNSQISAANVTKSQNESSMEGAELNRQNAELDRQIGEWENQLQQAQNAKISIDNDVSRINGDIGKYESQVKEYGNIIDALDGYSANRQAESDISKEIRAIDSNIKTLEEEKKQRQQFYGVENSSKRNVSGAKNDVSRRQ